MTPVPEAQLLTESFSRLTHRARISGFSQEFSDKASSPTKNEAEGWKLLKSVEILIVVSYDLSRSQQKPRELQRRLAPPAQGS